jgi:hypothetical protein
MGAFIGRAIAGAVEPHNCSVPAAGAIAQGAAGRKTYSRG